jgi:uncharacterized delta-60 repeat protein
MRIRRLFGLTMIGAVSASIVVAAGGDDARSSGWLLQERDGTLIVARGAGIHQEAGAVDKIGSFLLGLGHSAPSFDSAALSLTRFMPDGAPDARFGNGGAVLTPLLPLRNRNSADVTVLLQDSSGRLVVVGWRYVWTAMDSNVPVIIAARYSSTGALDATFGDRGIVTTRVEKAGVTQAFAAVLDGQDRLVVAGYSGGRKVKSAHGSFDDWSVNAILLRYTRDGVLDASFGDHGIATQAIDPSGKDKRSGREFLLYDYHHTETAGLVLDPQGRAVVAVSNDEGPALLMRYTPDGKLDPTFGSGGMVRASVGASFSIATLLRDSEGRLIAAGTSDDRLVLVRYSADGAPDSAFGAGGISSTPIGAGLRASAALEDRDGRVLAVASGRDGVLLARFDRGGTPDKTFGPDGVIRTAPGRSLTTSAALSIDAAGVPIVAVATLNGDKVLLTRYERDGPVELR